MADTLRMISVANVTNVGRGGRNEAQKFIAKLEEQSQ